MGMARHKLTDSKIRTLTSGIHSDGDGLYLKVQPGGTRSWTFIWKRFGRRREIGLGPYGNGARHVSLATARAKAEEARQIVGRGGDPKTDMAERRAAIAVVTFKHVADEYILTMQAKWRGRATLANWRRCVDIYCAPVHKVPIDKLSTDDVVRVLRPLWHDKIETATKVRERIKLVLDHAKARGLRSGDNPATWRGHLDQILPAHSKLDRSHHAAMPYADVPAFLQRLRGAGGVGARALEFAILTAVRSGEARGARWSEIDLDAKVWTIAATRMKSEKAHRVPLSDRALEIVYEMKATALSDLVFPGQRDNRPLSDMTMLKALKTAGGGEFTVHGFRSSFRDWTSEETNFQRETAEAALAHALGDSTERAYRRGDALEKRRALMTAWASYCAGEGGANVVAIGRAADGR